MNNFSGRTCSLNEQFTVGTRPGDALMTMVDLLCELIGNQLVNAKKNFSVLSSVTLHPVFNPSHSEDTK